MILRAKSISFFSQSAVILMFNFLLLFLFPCVTDNVQVKYRSKVETYTWPMPHQAADCVPWVQVMLANGEVLQTKLLVSLFFCFFRTVAIHMVWKCTETHRAWDKFYGQEKKSSLKSYATTNIKFLTFFILFWTSWFLFYRIQLQQNVVNILDTQSSPKCTPPRKIVVCVT